MQGLPLPEAQVQPWSGLAEAEELSLITLVASVCSQEDGLQIPWSPRRTLYFQERGVRPGEAEFRAIQSCRALV